MPDNSNADNQDEAGNTVNDYNDFMANLLNAGEIYNKILNELLVKQDLFNDNIYFDNSFVNDSVTNLTKELSK